MQSARRCSVALAAAGLAAAVVVGWAAPGSAQPVRAATSAARTVSANDNVLTVIAHDGKTKMWFNIHGTPHQGRVAMRFTNHGQYAHEMTLMRLKRGVTLAQFTKALQQPDPEKAANALLVNPDGEITGPALLGPGMSETVYAPLKAGNYVVLCFLPGPDGMPHALMGMVGLVKVRPSAGTVATPKTDGTIRLTNHKIVLPRGFTGRGTFKVTNTGTRAHDLSFARLKGRTSLPALFGCVGQSFGTNTMIDKCPGTLAGGVTDLAPGHTTYLRISLPEGRYGYVSTDGNDFQKGLNGTFRVR